MKKESLKPSKRGRVYTSILLLMLALVSITAATVAWFTIADRTRVHSMDMEVTTGASLRFDLDAHDSFEDYVKTLTFNQIANRIRQEKGFDMTETPLSPVTTSDYSAFTLEDGTAVSSSSGDYLEFTLNFMAQEDMVVHLTSASSAGNSDGTLVSSDNSALPQAMRISFTADGITYVYDPGMGGTSVSGSSAKTFGLPTAANMVLSDDNALFSLTEGENKAVVVRVWLEGTDEACTDTLRGADYSIRLRFIGTDSNNNELD